MPSQPISATEFSGSATRNGKGSQMGTGTQSIDSPLFACLALEVQAHAELMAALVEVSGIKISVERDFNSVSQPVRQTKTKGALVVDLGAEACVLVDGVHATNAKLGGIRRVIPVDHDTRLHIWSNLMEDGSAKYLGIINVRMQNDIRVSVSESKVALGQFALRRIKRQLRARQPSLMGENS